MNDYDITQRLSMHYKEFIAHDPYTFILKSEHYRHDWGRIGCLILYNKVSSLLNKKEIYEEDTKVLLLMKRLCMWALRSLCWVR
jgi:hypothetical protein